MGQGFAWAHPADPLNVGQFMSRRLGMAGVSDRGEAGTPALPDRCGPDQRRPPKSRSRNRNRLTKSR
jgi:hypothetical protein